MKRVVPSIAFLLFIFCPAFMGAAAQGSATVAGVVRDLQGTPQMGALIELLGTDTRVVAQTFTDDHGRYLLSSVTPGIYQLRATATLLLPALRANLKVNAGTRAVADMTMTAVFELGVLFPVEPRTGLSRPDDWRWTLRATANRPLLRLTDVNGLEPSSETAPAEPRSGSSVQAAASFGTTSGRFADSGPHQTLSFERAGVAGRTSMFRTDLGLGTVDGPGASLALSGGMERETLLGGEARIVAALEMQPGIDVPGGSGMQVVTLASSDEIKLGDAVMIDAGTLLTAERLVASRSVSAPYLRLVVAPHPGISLMYRLATSRALESSNDLDDLQVGRDLNSDAAGAPLLLRAMHQEIAAAHTAGSDTESVILYEDSLPYAELQGVGAIEPEELAGLPVAADRAAGVFHLAVPGYSARGLRISWTHTITADLTSSVSVDLGSALTVPVEPLSLSTVGAHTRSRRTPAVEATLRGRVPQTDTSFRAGYRWQPTRSLDAVDGFNTELGDAYLNLELRQRLWSGHRLHGVDAVVEARNLLEEGYQPMLGPDGETLFLAQVPRTMQAGLAFSF